MGIKGWKIYNFFSCIPLCDLEIHTRKNRPVIRVSCTWCSDMRSLWERRTVVTCGDRIAAWETPDMYLRSRVDTGTRSCAPMINRNRQKPMLRDVDIARSRNIADKFSFEYASSFSLSCEKRNLSSPLSSFFPHSLMTLFFRSPKARA